MEEKINAIKDALREVMQLLVQRGQPISPEIKATLAQVMEHAAERIKQLREEKQTGEPSLETAEIEQAQVSAEISPEVVAPAKATGGPVPELDSAPHESSNINAFRYDPKSGRLFVKFQDKYPSQNGPVYSYEGVPKNIFDVFRRGAVAPKTSGRNAWHRWKKGVTPSHGAAMYALIKQGGYPYQRVR